MTKGARKTRSSDGDSENPLEDIKKLLALIAIQNGASGEDLAIALGVSKSTVTRLLPLRKIKKNK